MADTTDLFSDLDTLIDEWCERRALNPLRILLPAYPILMGTSDEWHNLYNALRDISTSNGDKLKGDERERLNRVVVAIQKMLDVQR